MGTHVRRRETKEYHGRQRASIRRELNELKERIDAVPKEESGDATPTPKPGKPAFRSLK